MSKQSGNDSLITEKCKFPYSSGDLLVHHLPTSANEDQNQLSKFDIQLRNAWDKAMNLGYFRYTLDELQTKVLPGPAGYVAQRNLKRATQRRKPGSFFTVKQPFDGTRFNFNKINAKEILFELCPQHGLISQEHNDEESIPSRNLVIINVSPVEYCNILLVPAIEDCLPQAVTINGLQLAMEMLLLSSQRGFRIGFNSICGFASVNHLHFHAYCINYELPSEKWNGKPISGPCMELVDSPAKGFGFQYVNGDLRCFIKNIYRLTSLLHEKEIAHNIFITRGKPFQKNNISSDVVVRVLVWPRVSSLGAKDENVLSVAFCELAGHLIVKNESQFEIITDESISSLIHEISLPESEFKELRQNIQNLYSE
ncbi:uncharacterized protein TRIADDRAFT_52681 [Trichoplax adhaerens]|uniref:GDP-D-glucose phosphorylase 1 n=1 Tax=Trichoplax adhaerens TaxID=10228 RepID=B3RJU5_TRIAD|nr:hypothetical protein TRIADDRAFT_52681 [Trichoplax adhaerens]EDV29845.1 hypothetical protein TRIADDRAFT_52681 [Trichoplax adhaerens]|eukprot:XP_002109047.1 hypothetical protein TRIADDRAFT_52681 [Trichoplax adhaerens]